MQRGIQYLVCLSVCPANQTLYGATSYTSLAISVKLYRTLQQQDTLRTTHPPESKRTRRTVIRHLPPRKCSEHVRILLAFHNMRASPLEVMKDGFSQASTLRRCQPISKTLWEWGLSDSTSDTGDDRGVSALFHSSRRCCTRLPAAASVHLLDNQLFNWMPVERLDKLGIWVEHMYTIA